MSLYIDAVKKIKVGDPLDTTTFQGPQVSKLQFDKIMGYIESGKASNKAKVLLGGEAETGHGRDLSLMIGNAIPGDGYLIEPTIFSEVDMSMEIGAEEIFGPVSCVFRFEDEVEALKIANDTSVSDRSLHDLPSLFVLFFLRLEYSVRLLELIFSSAWPRESSPTICARVTE